METDVSSATALVYWLFRSRTLDDGLVTNKNANYIPSERKLRIKMLGTTAKKKILTCYVPNSAYCQMNTPVEITEVLRKFHIKKQK